MAIGMRSLSSLLEMTYIVLPKTGIYGSDQLEENRIFLMAGVNMDHKATPQIWHL